jgi:hypothetical protein
VRIGAAVSLLIGFADGCFGSPGPDEVAVSPDNLPMSEFADGGARL